MLKQDRQGGLNNKSGPVFSDQEGLVTAYNYNAWGDLTEVISPDTGTTTYRYDNAGNRIRKADASGQVTLYKYDELNRLTQVIPIGHPNEQVKYLYDDDSIYFGQVNYGIGRLTAIVDESGRTDYRYDHRGNVIRKTVTTGIDTFVTEYSYTKADRLASMTYPSGRVVIYQRDADGRITAVTTQENSALPAQNVATNISYKPYGPVDGYDLGNDISRTLTYDTDYLLTNIVDNDGSVYEPLDWFYQYDANANIDYLGDVNDSGNDQEFDYDKLNRLTDADGDYGDITYIYDNVGNRKIKETDNGLTTVTETYTYNYEQYTLVDGVRDNGSHQLEDVVAVETGEADETRSFQYTLDGHTKKDTKGNGDVYVLTYNSHQRYEQLDINNTPTAYYQHNALGQRTQKVTTETIQYHYDEQGRLIAESDQLGNTKDYIYADNMRLARYDNATAYYFHNDHLGRPIALTDSNKMIVWQAEYLPFGKAMVLANNTIDNELGFPGQVLDGESGFYYNYFRDYDSTTGRYLQSDPIGLEGGMNTYAYVNGNPVNAIDPLGLDCVAVNGSVTCTAPGGPTVTFPQPSGWPATMNSNSSNYHFYNIPVPLNGANAGCVMQGIVNNPTPGSPSPASQNGTLNNATPTTAQNLFNTIDFVSSFGNDPGGYNNSPVRSYTRNNGSVVVNVTMPGHPLHPGYVARTINGSTVNNFGEGLGALQGSNSPVAGLINGVWNGQTQGIVNNCGCP